jgi:hypothetical protein
MTLNQQAGTLANGAVHAAPRIDHGAPTGVLKDQAIAVKLGDLAAHGHDAARGGQLGDRGLDGRCHLHAWSGQRYCTSAAGGAKGDQGSSRDGQLRTAGKLG